MFGLWFEGQEREKEQLRLERTVDQAIGILAPHFGVTRETQWDKIKFPEVHISNFNGYDPNLNVLYLGNGVGAFSVGHETSHWFHLQLNKGLFLNWKAHKDDNVIEVVGTWGGVIYSGYSSILENVPLTRKYSLQRFVKMCRDEVMREVPDLDKQYLKLVIECAKCAVPYA